MLVLGGRSLPLFVSTLVVLLCTPPCSSYQVKTPPLSNLSVVDLHSSQHGLTAWRGLRPSHRLVSTINKRRSLRQHSPSTQIPPSPSCPPPPPCSAPRLVVLGGGLDPEDSLALYRRRDAFTVEGVVVTTQVCCQSRGSSSGVVWTVYRLPRDPDGLAELLVVPTSWAVNTQLVVKPYYLDYGTYQFKATVSFIHSFIHLKKGALSPENAWDRDFWRKSIHDAGRPTRVNPEML
jgi:hypothetical protein